MTDEEIVARDLRWTRSTIVILAIVGAVGLILLGIAAPGGLLTVLGTGTLLAGASFAVGGLLGFLFGIPRGPSTGETAAPDGSSPATRAGTPGFRHNTNLEQISDWLTKILVGVSLTQIRPIWDGIKDSAAAVERSSGLSQPAALGAMALYAIAGFLAGYLFTALFLGGAFVRAARAAGGPIAEKDLKSLGESSIQLAPQGGAAPLPAAAMESAKTVRKVELDQLKTLEELVVWARAQIAGGNYNEAVQAYQRALQQRPDDAQLRREYAVALAASKEYASALLELQRARERATSKEERESILLDLMFNSLYLDPPAGFQRALALADEYEKEGGDLTNARLCVYKACALGQWFKRQVETGRDDAELRSQLRAEALAAVKEALRVDPSWKPVLRSLLEGHDPEENDLVAFKDDPEFRQALA